MKQEELTVEKLIAKLSICNPKARVRLEGCDCSNLAEDIDTSNEEEVFITISTN